MAEQSTEWDLEANSGLQAWFTWLIAMLVVCLVLGAAFWMGRIDDGMYLTIGGLALSLIYKGYNDAKFIHHETQLASEQVKILENVDDFDTFFSHAKPSMFRAHIHNLHTISLSQPDISQDNLVEILHTRLMARNRLTELFSSILVTLGLIGTIIGLVLMMDGLQNAMAAGAGSDLLSKLVDKEVGPLRGLGTAFYTTLLGAISGGIILRVLTSVVDASIMRYTAHIAELSEVYVLPHLRRNAIASLA